LAAHPSSRLFHRSIQSWHCRGRGEVVTLSLCHSSAVRGHSVCQGLGVRAPQQVREAAPGNMGLARVGMEGTKTRQGQERRWLYTSDALRFCRQRFRRHSEWCPQAGKAALSWCAGVETEAASCRAIKVKPISL